ncbi:MAG: YifB family Mg chelatase-like AAA ATPase [Candidatus Pacebacteria bacterium]|nr:YifB family Mg chelatase-like AAA ATPase [Candidatus Paceibacterota bacterium]
MFFSKVHSAQTNMLKAYIVDIETDITKKTLNAFSIVGLPDKAIEESRDRVSAAIKNSGFKSPKSRNQKVITSLAPANIKKEGPNFDLGIALAYLLASEDIIFDPAKKIFLGELTLDGKLRKIDGTLSLVREAKKQGFEEVYLPLENTEEGALIKDIKIFGVKNLAQLIRHLNLTDDEQEIICELKKSPQTQIEYKNLIPEIDFADVKGQESAKRGLEIAASGGHNIAMYGPPGTGKSMLAKAFRGILPHLSFEDILETTSIHSVAGISQGDLVISPPFRSPHHTASYVSVVGGGVSPKPGEVTLAHKGILFLDEFPEFEKRSIEALRQPLEDGTVNISRAKGTATFPADFILIATMNPCPCGNYGTKKECICTPTQIINYQKKLSGPIIDRIDMWVEVSNIEHSKLSTKDENLEKSQDIQKRVAQAREIQIKRFENTKTNTNSGMSAKDIETLIPLSPKTKEVLISSASRLDLSARAYHKIIKLAQTIADLNQIKEILPEHILEALQYRPKKTY